jgi:hypothetical protein
MVVVAGALLIEASVRVGAAGDNVTVHVTAVDRKGNPAAGLQAADFEVKVGGKKIEVISAGPALTPMRIALIIADAGTGGFQGATANFIRKLSGRAEFALISVLVQPEIVVDYSSDDNLLRAGLRRIGPRGLERGAQMLETIGDAAKRARREGTRPVIVVMRVGGEASTTVSGAARSCTSSPPLAPNVRRRLKLGRDSPPSRPNSTTTKRWKARRTSAWCSATVPGNQEGVTTR